MRGRLNDLTGKQFGKLTAIKRVGSDNQRNAVWECKCDCGIVTKIRSSGLLSGDYISCGCSKKRTFAYGERFGKLTVVSQAATIKGVAMWKCLCDCGNVCEIATGDLTRSIKRGSIISCGCYRHELNIEQAKGLNIEGTKPCRLTSKVQANNKTGVRGVYWNKKALNYQAVIYFKKKQYYLGSFDSITEAAKVRKKAEQRIWGDFLDWYNNEYRKERTDAR